MNTLTRTTTSVGHIMSEACGLPREDVGTVWVLRNPQMETLSCAIVQDDGRLAQFMTRPLCRGQGNMRAMLDMLTEIYELLYVNYEVEGAALAALLGSGFLYNEANHRYVYRKESHEDM